jgi:ribulose bisphosphate carboxylase small subunit
VKGSGAGEAVKVSAIDPAGTLREMTVVIEEPGQEHCSTFQ